MCVKYSQIDSSLNWFSVKDKHRTLLRMNNNERPAIEIEVTITDFDGCKLTFSDYQIGDAPLLILNALLNKDIVFYQKEDLYVLYLFYISII